jgi:hypothetical protein
MKLSTAITLPGNTLFNTSYLFLLGQFVVPRVETAKIKNGFICVE